MFTITHAVWNGTSTAVPIMHGTAEQLAVAGATLAADHASRLTGKDWTAAAVSFLRGFAAQRGVFQCSDVREAAKGTFLYHPGIDGRAWGRVLQLANKEGIVKATGYAKTTRKESHGRQEQTWVYQLGVK